MSPCEGAENPAFLWFGGFDTLEEEERIYLPLILIVFPNLPAPRIWAFLDANKERWFTVHELSQELKIPRRTTSTAVKELTKLPHIESRDRLGRGRPPKEYRLHLWRR